MATAKTPGSKQTLRRQDKASRMTRLVSALVALLLFGLVVGGLWRHYVSPQTDVPAGRSVQLRIKDGASTREIASVLLKAGVIRQRERVRSHFSARRGQTANCRPGSTT